MKRTWPVFLVLLLMGAHVAQAQFSYANISIDSANNTNNPEQVSFVPTTDGTATITYNLQADFVGSGTTVGVSTNSIAINYADYLLYSIFYTFADWTDSGAGGGTYGSPSFAVYGGTKYYLSGFNTIGQFGERFQATVSYPVLDDNNFEWAGGVNNWTVLSDWLELDNPDGSSPPDYAAVNLPGPSDSVYVGDGGTPEITGAIAYATNLTIDEGSCLKISGPGSLNVGNAEFVGYSGMGTVTQNGGINGCSGFLCLGEYSGSTGSYVMQSGSLLNIVGSETVGQWGVGTFVQNGGTNAITVNAITAAIGDYSEVWIEWHLVKKHVFILTNFQRLCGSGCGGIFPGKTVAACSTVGTVWASA